eukprot:m.62351 g.62351  ORF g.62351 m.62351 type:complete len:404 (+) comp7134_c0_seq1:299-1510(+)
MMQTIILVKPSRLSSQISQSLACPSRANRQARKRWLQNLSGCTLCATTRRFSRGWNNLKRGPCPSRGKCQGGRQFRSASGARRKRCSQIPHLLWLPESVRIDPRSLHTLVSCPDCNPPSPCDHSLFLSEVNALLSVVRKHVCIAAIHYGHKECCNGQTDKLCQDTCRNSLADVIQYFLLRKLSSVVSKGADRRSNEVRRFFLNSFEWDTRLATTICGLPSTPLPPVSNIAPHGPPSGGPDTPNAPPQQQPAEDLSHAPLQQQSAEDLHSPDRFGATVHNDDSGGAFSSPDDRFPSPETPNWWSISGFINALTSVNNVAITSISALHDLDMVESLGAHPVSSTTEFMYRCSPPECVLLGFAPPVSVNWTSIFVGIAIVVAVPLLARITRATLAQRSRLRFQTDV